MPNIIDEYVGGKSIKELARTFNYPPYLFSRYVVEALTENHLGGGKKGLADALRNPLQRLGTLDVIAPQYRASEKYKTTATATRLAREVVNAIDSDPMMGPRHDKDRHMVGVEFEVVLEYKLKSLSEWVLLMRLLV